MQENRWNVLTILLKILKVKHTHNYASKLYSEYPNKSLHDVNKMLKIYSIDSIGVKVSNENINKLIFPIVIPFRGMFLVIIGINHDYVNFMTDGKHVKNIPVSEFMDHWSGEALLIKSTMKAIEPSYAYNIRGYLMDFFLKTIFFISILMYLVINFINSHIYSSLYMTSLFFLNILGVVIGTLIVKKELGVYDPLLNKICSNPKNCDEIFESSKNKIFNTISLGQIGLGYFISSVIILFHKDLVSYVQITSILSVLFSIWSIWYQKYILKKWCLLCLYTQAIIGSLFFINIFNFKFQFTGVDNVLLFLSIYTFFIIFVYIFCSILDNMLIDKHIKNELNTLKKNKQVFFSLLSSQKYFEINKEISSIKFGNITSNNILTVVLSLNCIPCTKLHYEILNKTRDKDLCIQYILKQNDKLDVANEFFIWINATYNIEERNKIYSSWFSYGRYDVVRFFNSFSFKYVNESIEYYKHKKWQEYYHLNYTPILILNGYEVPKEYSIEDLFNLF